MLTKKQKRRNEINIKMLAASLFLDGEKIIKDLKPKKNNYFYSIRFLEKK